MRFYNIDIVNTITSQFSAGGNVVQNFTSLVGGVNDPGALNVEFDIIQSGYSIPKQGSYVRVWGIPLKMIAQASNLNKKNIIIKAGMSKGLPLANPFQQGVIAQAGIFPAFGNWIGTAQTLDLILSPPFGQESAPKNLAFNWKAGTPLSTAITNTLQTAFDSFTTKVNISPNLVLSYDQVGFYETLGQFNDYLLQISQKILGTSTYSGVNISQKGNQVLVDDGTTKTTPKAIEFQDLIGQPTWIGPQEINFRCVMRGDLGIGDSVTMPKTIAQQTQAFAVNQKQSSIFQGSFTIRDIHHTGNFRQPDGASWSTMFNAVQPGSGGEQ